MFIFGDSQLLDNISDLRIRSDALGNGIGAVKDDLVRTPILGQRVLTIVVHVRPVTVGKVSWEVQDVVGGSSAPAIDGLQWIPHCRDGMAPAVLRRRTAEQTRQQTCLGARGVLVLIEQHHRIPRPYLLADPRKVSDQLDGLVEAVGEPEETPFGKAFTIRLCIPHQLITLLCHVLGPGHVDVRLAVLLGGSLVELLAPRVIGGTKIVHRHCVR